MKLNLGCNQWYKDGWVNVDNDPSVRVDLCEDVQQIASIRLRSVEEIYAGHVLEHLPHLRQALYCWRELLVPGGRLTVAVPDLPGAIELWARRLDFPALGGGPDAGLLAVTHGYAPGTEYQGLRHYRFFDAETLEICLLHAGFLELAAVDDHPCMVKPSSELGWQIARTCVAPY
jgi:hypothetical protein